MYLKLNSELVFVGDAGTTEAGRLSKRYGVEWNTRSRPLPWLFADLDVAWNHVSPLPGEPVDGVADIHVHPSEKRSFRVSLSYTF